LRPWAVAGTYRSNINSRSALPVLAGKVHLELGKLGINIIGLCPTKVETVKTDIYSLQLPIFDLHLNHKQHTTGLTLPTPAVSPVSGVWGHTLGRGVFVVRFEGCLNPNIHFRALCALHPKGYRFPLRCRYDFILHPSSTPHPLGGSAVPARGVDVK
jgi:hypothetical protein